MRSQQGGLGRVCMSVQAGPALCPQGGVVTTAACVTSLSEQARAGG